MYSAPITLDVLLRTLYQPHRLLGCSPKTSEQYAVLANHIRQFSGREVPIRECLTADFAAPYMAWRLTGVPLPEGSTTKRGKPRRFLRPPVVAQTVNKELRQLRALYGFAAERGLIPSHDSSGQPICYVDRVAFLPELKRHKACWYPDELSRVLRSARQEQLFFSDVPATLFWPALVLVDFNCGVRVNALMRARRSDVDLDKALITFRAETQKHKADDVYELRPETIEALRAIWMPDRDLLFPWPWDGDGSWRTLRKHYKRILRRAGLPADRTHLFHKIRRTTATYIFRERGIHAAQAHLRHSHERVTWSYIDDSKARPHDSARVLPALDLT